MRVVLFVLLAAASASAQRPALRKSSNTASVQFMVTKSMTMDLYKLGYTAEDVKSLSPERAAAIIDKSIRRPREGVPASWKRGGGGGGGGGGGLARAIGWATKIGGFGLATALALHCSGMDLGDFSRFVDTTWEHLREASQPRTSRRSYRIPR